ncbi:MAG: deaminase [Candidatus Hatepunaea meridiana]|nr:deaminase [Candidatus Hatepunaea meridiana]
MRQTWHQYFLTLAKHVSTRATCDRLHAGCVIVKDKRIVSTGYNGSLPGADHCDDVGHLIMNGHCIATEHAERNAVANAARAGVSTLGSTAYVTHSPCWDCIKHLAAAGVKEIIYSEEYKNAEATYPPNIDRILDQAGVKLRMIED